MPIVKKNKYDSSKKKKRKKHTINHYLPFNVIIRTRLQLQPDLTNCPERKRIRNEMGEEKTNEDDTEKLLILNFSFYISVEPGS